MEWNRFDYRSPNIIIIPTRIWPRKDVTATSIRPTHRGTGFIRSSALRLPIQYSSTTLSSTPQSLPSRSTTPSRWPLREAIDFGPGSLDTILSSPLPPLIQSRFVRLRPLGLEVN